MSNTSDKLREFGQKVMREYGRWWGIEEKDTDKFLSDLTALISEGYYPKEFVEWLLKKELRYSSMLNKFYQDSDSGIVELTIHDLFYYWTKNIKQ